MSVFTLSVNTVRSNYSLFREKINTLFKTRSKQLNKLYDDLGEERVMLAPASSVSHYHNAMPGGYVDHVLRVMDFAIIEYKSVKHIGLDVDTFTKEELLFSALNHDLGKLGFVGVGNDNYLINDSEWHRKNQGKIYKHNPKIPFGLIQDKSIFMLQSYQIPCSWNEYIAIKTHDGLYDDTNKPYYISRSPDSKFKSYLPILIHHADLKASQFEYERWVKNSN